jgi:hypothetical protein
VQIVGGVSTGKKPAILRHGYHPPGGTVKEKAPD